jgi:hypothetical protein
MSAQYQDRRRPRNQVDLLEEYQPTLFLSPIPRHVSSRDVGDAVQRMRLGTVGGVVVKQGKYVDYAIVTMSHWDLRASAKLRNLMYGGGFMKVFYGENSYWKATEYKSKPRQAPAAQFLPETPDFTPPGTPRAPEKEEQGTLDPAEIALLCQNLEATVLATMAAKEEEDSVSDLSDEYHNGRDRTEEQQEEAGVLLDYGVVSTKRPAKRLRVKAQLTTNK